MKHLMNIDESRSYVTEDNLIKAIEKKFGSETDNYIVVCNRKGRYTAVFHHHGPYARIHPADVANFGFPILGF